MNFKWNVKSAAQLTLRFLHYSISHLKLPTYFILIYYVHRAFVLVREAQELTNWIKTKEQHAQTADVGEDLEQVELMQKKFDDFQTDLKANEQRYVWN